MIGEGNNTFLDVSHISKTFFASRGLFMPQHGRIHAVQDVTFTVHRGETLGLVGESGCGKSTLARLLVRLMEPDSGAIMLEGKNIYHFDRRMMLHFRRRVQIIFQDPMSSLNPRMTVGRIIAEPLKIHGIVARRNVKERVNELLHMVGLQPDAAQRYPHEFSSGQRQRIGIARALSLQPECIIADEPVSSLDVSIQAQILNLLAELQEKFHLTYVFISHDLSVVKHISTRVAVMYAGRIVEIAPRSQLYETPIHPYTEALLSAVPIPDPAITKKRVRLSGEPPRLDKAMHGCVFFHRCPIAKETICALNTPVLEEKRQGHWAACFLQPNAPAA